MEMGNYAHESQTKQGRNLDTWQFNIQTRSINKQQKTVTKNTFLMLITIIHNEIIIDMNFTSPLQKRRCNLCKREAVRCLQGDTLIMDNFHKQSRKKNISKKFVGLSNE